ncbi:MAG: PilZ domain-containing protein, partial [Treponema sp.]
LRPQIEFDDIYEKAGGIKCVIKNISEDGAMIYVKGKAEKGVNIKLQCKINEKPVVMCGYIVRFIYDEEVNTSKIHFNCTRVTEQNRNNILSFVYNIAGNKNTDINALIFENEDSSNDFNDIDTSKLDTIENMQKLMEDKLSNK